MLGHRNLNGGIFFQEEKGPVNYYQYFLAIVISQENWQTYEVYRDSMKSQN